MEKYFKVHKDTETGKKFSILNSKMTECFEAQKALSIKYDFDEWRQGLGVGYGGIYSAIFNKKPDIKIWKQETYFGLKNEYVPKKNSKLGKIISEEFAKLPVISKKEINSCIGYNSDSKGQKFICIGINILDNKEYFGFVVDSDWGIDIPSDCIEITGTEYENI